MIPLDGWVSQWAYWDRFWFMRFAETARLGGGTTILHYDGELRSVFLGAKVCPSNFMFCGEMTSFSRSSSSRRKT
jgi:hypothetical protein